MTPTRADALVYLPRKAVLALEKELTPRYDLPTIWVCISIIGMARRVGLPLRKPAPSERVLVRAVERALKEQPCYG